MGYPMSIRMLECIFFSFQAPLEFLILLPLLSYSTFFSSFQIVSISAALKGICDCHIYRIFYFFSAIYHFIMG